MGTDVTALSAIPGLVGGGGLTAGNASAYPISEFAGGAAGEEMDETRQDGAGGYGMTTKR